MKKDNKLKTWVWTTLNALDWRGFTWPRHESPEDVAKKLTEIDDKLETYQPALLEPHVAAWQAEQRR